MTENIKALEAEIAEFNPKILQLREEIQRGIVGQTEMIEGLLIGILAGGHVLLEGLPGLAKTRTVTRLAQALDLNFSRIQFTPDMLPADLLGTQVFNPKDSAFRVEKGPLFAHIVLADEINRAPAKVQAALLEVMQEKQITLAKETFRLEPPFLVLATQNPIEQEGTYPLPEAQIDRFMLKLKVPYPTKAEEREILDLIHDFRPSEPAQTTTGRDDLLQMGRLMDQIYLDPKIKDYIVDLVQATRNPADYGMAHLSPLIEIGASPRASITLAIAGRAKAFLSGKGYVTPEMIKSIAPAVLRHRLILSYEAEAEEMDSDQIIDQLLNQIPVP